MSDIARHWIDGEWTESELVAESASPATGAHRIPGGQDLVRVIPLLPG
jgi:hypothetical protein